MLLMLAKHAECQLMTLCQPISSVLLKGKNCGKIVCVYTLSRAVGLDSDISDLAFDIIGY